MKTLKGIAVYSLVVLGILLVIGGLLIGCMFMFKGFTVFGWAFLSKDSQTASITSEDIKASETYNVNVDAGLYAVTVSLRDDTTTQQVYLTYVNDMYGLYHNKKYNDAYLVPKIETAVTYNINTGKNEKNINITAPVLEGLFTARKSSIYIALPRNNEYNLNVKSTSGNIIVTGNSKQDFPLKALEVNTDSGNINFGNIRNKAYCYVHFDENDKNLDGIVNSLDDVNKDGVIDEKDVVPNLKHPDVDGNGKNTDKEDKEGYFTTNITDKTNRNFVYRVIPIEKLKVSTNKGKINFKLSGGNILQRNEIIVLKDFKTATSFSNIDELNAILENKEGYTEATLKVKKGDVNFGQLYCSKFDLSGDDVLLRASGITSYEDFTFNSPSGLFDIGALNSPLNTITTKNISIKLGRIFGELAVNTTYGNIQVEETNNNTSLNSVHGNITVKHAKNSISAISEYGNINVKYSGKAYFKNNHGTTNVEFVKLSNTGLSKDAEYSQTCDIITGNGTVDAKNLMYETTITSNNGGKINAQFSEMYEVTKDIENGKTSYLNHKIVLNSGSANIKIPQLKEFMFKGTGNIGGAIGSANMQATENFVQILGVGTGNVNTLAHLEVNANNGANAQFSVYWNEN